MLHSTLYKRLIPAAAILLAATAASAQAPPAGCATPEINVLTTVAMIGDVAANIGGNCVTVRTMVGPGVDPHLYTATARDVETLFDAEIIFYAGINLESRLIDVFEQIEENLGTATIAVSEAVPPERILREVGMDAPDPHVWMDAQLWAYAAGAIQQGLSAYLPEQAAYFEANAEAYLQQIADLDSYVREQIARIPEAQRVLVTAHDAFQYYGHAYNIEVYAPQGITTAAEVGVQDIRSTVALLIERQIPAIFVESSVSPDVVEAIQAGAQAQGLDVLIGGSLYSDSMGAAGTEDGTYLGMIRANTDTIVAALMGEGEAE